MLLSRVRKFLVLITMLVPAACATTPQTAAERHCMSAIHHATEAINHAKLQGLDGTLAWGQAATMLARAKVNQQLKRYSECQQNAEQARSHIRASQR